MQIFYFTGTGNSLKGAMMLREQIKDSEIIAIKDVINIDEYNISSNQIGFIFPVYFYGLPRIVERFIKKVDLSKANYIFSVATAMFPNGQALTQLNELLLEKNKELNYGRYLKMPTNYVSAFNPLADKKRDKVLRKADEKIYKVASDIITNKNLIQKESKVYKMITRAEANYDKWKVRVNETDKEFIIEDSCTSCGICEKVCPVNNIAIKDGKPAFKNKCEQCYGCINLCPNKSITYDKMKEGRYKHPDISLKQIIGDKDEVI